MLATMTYYYDYNIMHIVYWALALLSINHISGTVIVDYRGYRVVGQSIISGILS